MSSPLQQRGGWVVEVVTIGKSFNSPGAIPHGHHEDNEDLIVPFGVGNNNNDASQQHTESHSEEHQVIQSTPFILSPCLHNRTPPDRHTPNSGLLGCPCVTSSYCGHFGHIITHIGLFCNPFSQIIDTEYGKDYNFC